MIHRIISKLEAPRPPFRPGPLEKPKPIPQPSSDNKAKFKVKNCNIKLKDITQKKSYARAMEVFKKEKHMRMRFKRDKLLEYLNTVGYHRTLSTYKMRKMVPASSSSDSDSDTDSRFGASRYDSKFKQQHQKNDDLTHLGGFK